MTDFSEMTDWEVDKAVAGIVKKITRHRGSARLLVDDGLELVHITGGGTWYPSTHPGDFADVEHWIEQQGWVWWASYEPWDKSYFYNVRNPKTDVIKGAHERESRMRAGCIALLRMLGE